MNYSQMLQILRYRLGNRTDLDSRIELEIAFAQSDMEQNFGSVTMPWFLYKSATLTGLTGTATLPADFLREQDDGSLLYSADGVTWTKMNKVFPEEMQDALLGNCRPDGIVYAITGNQLEIYPSPPGEYSVRLPYFASQPTLSSTNSSNAWSNYAPELLVASAGEKLAKYIHDANLAQLFAAEKQDSRQAVVTATEQRNLANIDMRTRVS